MIQDIKSGEKCVFGGEGGQVILLVVSRGGSRVFTFSSEGGGGSGKIWVINQDLSRPPPDT